MYFQFWLGDADWEPRYNIAPTRPVGIIRQDATEPQRRFSLARWRLIPYFSNYASVGRGMINARAETDTSKPAFSDPFQHRRCLIPADGSMSGSAERRPSSHFTLMCRMILCSGLQACGIDGRNPAARRWTPAQILTTRPNSLLADVHDRMPVILSPAHYELWLNPGFGDAGALVEILKPFDTRLMKRYPVSTRVNLVTNGDAECAAVVMQSQASLPLM